MNLYTKYYYLYKYNNTHDPPSPGCPRRSERERGEETAGWRGEEAARRDEPEPAPPDAGANIGGVEGEYRGGLALALDLTQAHLHYHLRSYINTCDEPALPDAGANIEGVECRGDSRWL